MMVLFFYIVMFPIQITVYRSIHFYSYLSVFDEPNFTDRISFHFPVSVTDRIKTYTSKNSEIIFPTISTLKPQPHHSFVRATSFHSSFHTFECHASFRVLISLRLISMHNFISRLHRQAKH
jgi:hypothetical protein